MLKEAQQVTVWVQVSVSDGAVSAYSPLSQ